MLNAGKGRGDAPRLRPLVRLLALALPLLGLLVGLELSLRLVGYAPLADLSSPDPQTRARAVLVRPSPNDDVGYELTPGAEHRAWGASVRVNALGLRDREYSAVKPAGTRRILAAGDSVTFGAYVELADTYAKQLERRLAERGSFEVLNLGVPGYDALQTAARLEDAAERLAPDLAVVGFVVNDLGVVSVERTYLERVRRYGGALYRSRLVQWLALRRDELRAIRYGPDTDSDQQFEAQQRGKIASISGDATLAELMRRLAEQLERAGQLPEFHRPLAWYASAPRVGKLRYSFERLRRLAASQHFKVAIAVIPYLDEGRLRNAYDLAYSIVEHEARRAGFDAISLAAAFRAEGPERLLIPGRDGRLPSLLRDRLHPNAIGHALIADALERYIVERFRPGRGGAAP